MKTTDELFGYQTFVSPPDEGRNRQFDEKNQLEIDNAYTMPKKFYDFFDDFIKYKLRLGPANAVYQDPEVVYNDYAEYEDMLTNSVVSAYLHEHYPVVIHPELANKIAATMDEITRGLDSGIRSRSHECRVSLKRAMPKYNRYIFSVKSRDGSGAHVVTIKADTGDDRVKKFDKADIIVSCSCPFWVYYGCEFHARKEKYLDGKPKGTATYPKERDPKGTNKVCKHVYAVFDHVRGYVYRRKDDELRGKEKEIPERPERERPERDVGLRGKDREERELERQELKEKELEKKKLREEQKGEGREKRKEKEEERKEKIRLEREEKEQKKEDLLKDVEEELEEEEEDLRENKKEPEPEPEPEEEEEETK